MYPALEQALLRWKTQSHRIQPTDFVFLYRLYGGRKALDLAAVLKKKDSARPSISREWLPRVGTHFGIQSERCWMGWANIS